MPALLLSREPVAPEYFHLSGVRPAGPQIGRLGDTPIWEAISDAFGRRFTYAGVAPRLADGRIDYAALRRGEFLDAAGIVYRFAAQAPSAA